MKHIPVLEKEVLEYLDPQANENFIDCTLGGGGHSLAILSKNGPDGKVLGIETDEEMLKNTEHSRLIKVNGSYSDIQSIAEENNFFPISGIIFDLGFSSWHIDESERGFSFLRNEPLDMRYNLGNGLTAWEIVNRYPENKLAEVIEKYGEERKAKKIAREIIKRRPIDGTFELNRAIKAVSTKGRIHQSTRTFQALRIEVNKELENIEKGLLQAMDIVSSGGRIAVISFHSLEDRIVKNIFKKDKRFKILTKKPVTASLKEKKENSRARSAKLRAIKKCTHYL